MIAWVDLGTITPSLVLVAIDQDQKRGAYPSLCSILAAVASIRGQLTFARRRRSV